MGNIDKDNRQSALDSAFEDLALDELFDPLPPVNSSQHAPAPYFNTPLSEKKADPTIKFGRIDEPEDWQKFTDKYGDVRDCVSAVIKRLEIGKIMEGISSVCGPATSAPLNDLFFMAVPEGRSIASVQGIGLNGLSHEIVDGKFTVSLSGVSNVRQSEMFIPLGLILDCKESELGFYRRSLTEHIIHYLVPNIPVNEFIARGISGAAISLMAQDGYLDKNYNVSGIKLFSGFESGGLNCGDFRNENDNALTSLIAEGGSCTIYNCLGDNDQDVSENIKRLIGVSINSGRNLSGTEAWLGAVETMVPGFSARFLADRLSKPLSEGEKLAFVTRGIPNGKSLWGNIYCFDYQPNLNFGKPKFHIPHNIEPLIHHFDRDAGKVSFKNVLLRFNGKDGGAFEAECLQGEDRGCFPFYEYDARRIFEHAIEKHSLKEEAFYGVPLEISVFLENQKHHPLGNQFVVEKKPV
jgi:hypothetical protein